MTRSCDVPHCASDMLVGAAGGVDVQTKLLSVCCSFVSVWPMSQFDTASGAGSGGDRKGQRPIRPETAQTLDRGLWILEILGSSEGHSGLTISQLASRLQVGRSVIYRLVATLLARGFATRATDGRVRLGPTLGRLSVAVRPILAETARPLLGDLAEQTGATVHLTVAERDEAVALAVVEPSWTEYHIAYRIGSRHPLDQGSAGRAILAGRSGRAGVVTTAGELQSGAHGMSAPVVGVPGLEASVGVVSMKPLSDPRVEAAVLDCAAAIARALTGDSAPD